MSLTRNQIIVISVGAVLFFLLLLGFIFRPKAPPPLELNFWGAGSDERVFNQLIYDYSLEHPNVQVRYHHFPEETYEEDLINGLATSEAPDIFMFKNTWLPRHIDKLIPISEEQLTLTEFREFYPAAVEQDFVSQGQIFALPLYLDTLALIYNADRFDQLSIAQPPKNWIALAALVQDKKLRILTPYAVDFLTLLMMQSGMEIVDRQSGRIFISGEPGVKTLAFFRQVARYLPQAREELFLGGADAIFGYERDYAELKENNPAMRLTVGAMPQYLARDEVNFPNYYGLAVSRPSGRAAAAWDFIKFLTARGDINQRYLQATGQPPALRSLINQHFTHPELNVFARQALTARSWPQIDPGRIEAIFARMLESVESGGREARQALNEAEAAINQLLWRRR